MNEESNQAKLTLMANWPSLSDQQKYLIYAIAMLNTLSNRQLRSLLRSVIDEKRQRMAKQKARPS